MTAATVVSELVVRSIGCEPVDTWVAALGVGVVGAVALNTPSLVGAKDSRARDL